MKTLQEIKNDVADECGFSDGWNSLLITIKGDIELLDFYFDIVATAYAEQSIEASVELVEFESFEKDILDPTGFVLSRLSDKIDNLKEELK